MEIYTVIKFTIIYSKLTKQEATFQRKKQNQIHNHYTLEDCGVVNNFITNTVLNPQNYSLKTQKQFITNKFSSRVSSITNFKY